MIDRRPRYKRLALTTHQFTFCFKTWYQNSYLISGIHVVMCPRLSCAAWALLWSHQLRLRYAPLKKRLHILTAPMYGFLIKRVSSVSAQMSVNFQLGIMSEGQILLSWEPNSLDEEKNYKRVLQIIVILVMIHSYMPLRPNSRRCQRCNELQLPGKRCSLFHCTTHTYPSQENKSVEIH